MAIRLSVALRNKMLSAADFQTAFANGVCYIFSGPQPATANDAVRGTLLGIITKDAGAFAFGTGTNGLNFDEASGGAITKAAAETWQVGDGAGVAGAITAGTAGWFRLMGNPSDALGGSNTTNARLDGSIATSGADLNLPNVDLISGTPITIDTFTFTMPAA